MVATSAVRDATNGAAFISQARAAVGVSPEVLSGTEEGQLAYAGANADLPPFAGDTLVVDIGGGSTELTLGREGSVCSISLQLGCVRLTERHLIGDPPPAAAVGATYAAIDAELERGEREQPELVDLRPERRLVGLAGTVSTLASMKLEVADYEPEKLHHATIAAAEVHQMCQELGGLTAERRRALVGMVPGREDVILGGALVLDRVLARYHFPQVIVSERDILDGIALSLA
jgi:exopolyphosphatase/guanosine-5'-triphosphate,3'-diphosphate pyrophosphatase